MGASEISPTRHLPVNAVLAETQTYVPGSKDFGSISRAENLRRML